MVDYRAKVRKLMETAASFTEQGNEEAALTFAEKAAALATKHGIQDALAESFDEVKLNIIRKRVTLGNPYPKHRITLLARIAKHLSCKVIKMGRNGAELFGDERDVERVMFIYRLVSTHMLDGVSKASPKKSTAEHNGGYTEKHWYFKKEGLTPAEVKSFRVSWVVGYIAGIDTRMAEAYAQTVAEAKVTNPGAAVVLADRKALAEKLLAETHPKLGKAASSKIRHAEAYYQGRNAAGTADLGQTRIDSERLGITA